MIFLINITYVGVKIAAAITSATKLIEIRTVNTEAISLLLNTHIINIVQTVLVTVPNTPATAAGKTSDINLFCEEAKNLFNKT